MNAAPGAKGHGGRQHAARTAGATTLEVLTWRIVVVALLAIAWIITPGKDFFRVPKSALLAGEAIVLAAIAVGAALAGRLRLPRERPLILLLAGAVVLWTCVTTITSTNRTLSLPSLFLVAGCAIIFGTTYVLGRRQPLNALGWLFAAMLPNAVLVLLQEFRVWNPLWAPEVLNQPTLATSHQFSTALIGNPDDVGCWFVVPTIVAAALIRADPRRRPYYGALTALCMAVLLTSRSVTAIVAAITGIVLVAGGRSWRHMISTTAIAVLVVGVSMTAYAPLRHRTAAIARLMEAGDYDAVLTARGTPFLAAAQMALDHPLTGVGPGCFGFQYYPYKVAVESRYPGLLSSGSREWNFGEVHNDHLQTIAEAGLPAYALLCAFAFAVARISFKPRVDEETDVRRRFARVFALPFVAAMTVLMFAQFPLQLASTVSIVMYATALTAAWSEDER